jgi:hypothetical protein
MRTCMHILLFCFNFVPSNFNFFIGPQVTFIELWRNFLFQPLVFLFTHGFPIFAKTSKNLFRSFYTRAKIIKWGVKKKHGGWKEKNSILNPKLGSLSRYKIRLI